MGSTGGACPGLTIFWGVSVAERRPRVRVFTVCDDKFCWSSFETLSRRVGEIIGCSLDFRGFSRWYDEAREKLGKFGFGGVDLLVFDQFGDLEWLSEASKALASEFGIKARMLLSTRPKWECEFFVRRSGEPVFPKPFGVEELAKMYVTVLSSQLGLKGLRVYKPPKVFRGFVSSPVV